VDLKIELTFSIEAYASSHLDQYRPKIISATNGDVESILRAVARGSTRLWSLFLALCRVFNGSIFSLIQGVCTSVFDRWGYESNVCGGRSLATIRECMLRILHQSRPPNPTNSQYRNTVLPLFENSHLSQVLHASIYLRTSDYIPTGAVCPHSTGKVTVSSRKDGLYLLSDSANFESPLLINLIFHPTMVNHI